MFPYDRTGGAISGCLMLTPGAKPSMDGACIYLNADLGLDLILSRAEPAGGKLLLPRTPVGENMGYFGHIADPEGNRIGLHSMQ